MKFVKNLFQPKKENSVENVLNSISEEALFSAFDLYEYIYSLPEIEKTGVEISNLSNMKKVWVILKNLNENKNDLSKLSQEELKILSEGPVYYDDLVRILINHHNDEVAASYIFKRRPELHSVIPKQYDNPLQIIEVLIEYIRTYQWILENFIRENIDALNIVPSSLK